MHEDTATRSPSALNIERAVTVILATTARSRWISPDYLATIAGVSASTMRRRLETGHGWSFRELSAVVEHLGEDWSRLMEDAELTAHVWETSNDETVDGGGR